MAEVILVTQQEFAKGEKVFRAAHDFDIQPAASQEQSLADAVVKHNSRAIIVGVEPYRGPLYAALGKSGGAIIARFGVGHDSVDKVQARQHNIIVTNTPGVLDVSVAEQTMWLLGCLVRRVAHLHGKFRAGEFSGQTGTEVRGKTLGLIGLGGIARRVAAIAHSGFGMRVIAAGRRPAEQITAAPGVEHYTNDTAAVFRQADIVSIHLPANAETRHYVNVTRLALMKPGALLINTGRGSLVDEAALYDTLASSHLGGAALDVFEREPYVPASPDKDLRALDNVVFTPHIGSNTREANERMAQASLANVANFLAGRLSELTRV